jgi:hypothetical protein
VRTAVKSHGGQAALRALTPNGQATLIAPATRRRAGARSTKTGCSGHYAPTGESKIKGES